MVKYRADEEAIVFEPEERVFDRAAVPMLPEWWKETT
jgi:hypothetical protein